MKKSMFFGLMAALLCLSLCLGGCQSAPAKSDPVDDSNATQQDPAVWTLEDGYVFAGLLRDAEGNTFTIANGELQACTETDQSFQIVRQEGTDTLAFSYVDFSYVITEDGLLITQQSSDPAFVSVEAIPGCQTAVGVSVLHQDDAFYDYYTYSLEDSQLTSWSVGKNASAAVWDSTLTKALITLDKGASLIRVSDEGQQEVLASSADDRQVVGGFTEAGEEIAIETDVLAGEKRLISNGGQYGVIIGDGAVSVCDLVKNETTATELTGADDAFLVSSQAAVVVQGQTATYLDLIDGSVIGTVTLADSWQQLGLVAGADVPYLALVNNDNQVMLYTFS